MYKAVSCRPRLLALGLLVPVLMLAGSGAPVRAASIQVPAGGDLQAAIDRAAPGDVILLEPGATYVGNFVLPVKPGRRYITIQSGANPSLFPRRGRVAPEHARWMPTIRSPNGEAALSTRPGAHHWQLQWLVFGANAGGAGDIITLGDGDMAVQRDLAAVPQHFILDGLIIRGDPERGQKRAIALNSGSTIIRNSDIRDIKTVGQDSQAICGWNGPGPYLIENNYLEGAGENVMFGGADPAIIDLVPSDITFRGNYVTKPLHWRGSQWTVKNLFELKSARRVLIERNIFEHNWEAAQSGYAILFTPANQDGRAPWTVVTDVTFQFNIVRHVSSGITVLGYDYTFASRQTRGLQIRHNLFYDVSGARWGGQGWFMAMGNEPADIVIDHNTVIQSGTLMVLYGNGDGRPLPIENVQFTNNIVLHNELGIFGDGVGVGNAAIQAYMRRPTVRRNVIAGGNASQYPADNFFPAVDELLAEFVDAAREDYELQPTSQFSSASVSGMPVGAAVRALRRRMPPPPPFAFSGEVQPRSR